MRKGKASRKVYGVTQSQWAQDEYICPCCLQVFEQKDMVRHHVHWYALGGHGFRWNMLFICRTCHALETMGVKADMCKVYMRCFWYMLAEYGVLFLLQPGLRQRYIRPLFERLPRLDSFGKLLRLCRQLDVTLRDMGRAEYRHEMRDGNVALNVGEDTSDVFVGWSYAASSFLQVPEVREVLKIGREIQWPLPGIW